MVKKKSKAASKRKAGLKKIQQGVSTTASSIVDEIDKAKDLVLHEIREGFEVISGKAKTAGQTAADAGATVKETIAEAHPAERFHKLVDEVEEIAEDILEGISSKFGQLREAASKVTTRKKTTVNKKTAVKKKSATKKKAPAKKAAVKKKSAIKKKAAASDPQFQAALPTCSNVPAWSGESGRCVNTL